MDVISRSSLNPNAPIFVPFSYRAVEDFSDQWWELVESSSWFRDYWLQECFQDPQNEPEFDESDDLFLPEIDDVFDGYSHQKEEKEEEDYHKELVSLGAMKWRRSRGNVETPKFEKAPKFVNVKVSPRPIQQPR